jgi:hypothetical protein
LSLSKALDASIFASYAFCAASANADFATSSASFNFFSCSAQYEQKGVVVTTKDSHLSP